MVDVTGYSPSSADAVALLAGAGAVAGSYAAVGLTPAFAASPLERWLARAVPGFVVTVVIERLGSLGQQLNLLTAAVLTALALAALVRLSAFAGDRLRNRAAPVVLGGAFVSTGTAVLTGGLVSASAAALGAGAVLGAAAVVSTAELSTRDDPDRDRRRVVGAVVAATGVGGLALARSSSTARDAGPSIPEDASPTVRQNLRTADRRSLDVDGIEPLVSRDFYRVDINAADPVVDAEEWSLSITGEVDTERTYSLSDIRSMDSRTEFNTLRCVGDSLNGEQLDNALWTGVPTATLLDRAGPDSGCGCVRLNAADDYFQVFPIDALADGMLAYEMNGRDLPRGHGYPLRALVPGHWGEVQVKWLTEIEVLDRDAEGYWERRGWHGTGPVTTVAKLWAVNALADGRKQVAGHAYAGTRGVSAVEVSTDGGENWNEARLSEELPGGDVWRQWAYEYQPSGGRHDVVVRAIEADGTVQTSEETGRVPSGATGWVSRTVR